MRKHHTDGFSLTFGLLFLLVVGWYLAADLINLSAPDLGWFVAGVLILLGVLGLLGALRNNRSSGPSQVETPAPDPIHPYRPQPAGSTGSDDPDPDMPPAGSEPSAYAEPHERTQRAD